MISLANNKYNNWTLETYTTKQFKNWSAYEDVSLATYYDRGSIDCSIVQQI